MDDRAVGLVLRALRRRRGWRQVDLAARARCSQALVSQVERGHVAGCTIQTLRKLFTSLDARLQLAPGWRGAELDRLLDADHARVVEGVARRLDAAGWQVLLEVTYAVGAERGSIDVLALHPIRRAALVAEIKTDIPAAEAVARKLDEKGRLAAAIVPARIGWVPAVVGTVLVLPDTDRLRRLLAGPAAALARSFPVSARALHRWLRRPEAAFAATWFVSDIPAGNARSARRIRRPGTGPRETLQRTAQHMERLPEDPPSRILR